MNIVLFLLINIVVILSFRCVNVSISFEKYCSGIFSVSHEYVSLFHFRSST